MVCLRFTRLGLLARRRRQVQRQALQAEGKSRIARAIAASLADGPRAPITHDGSTPLHWAAYAGCEPAVAARLDARALAERAGGAAPRDARAAAAAPRARGRARAGGPGPPGRGPGS